MIPTPTFQHAEFPSPEFYLVRTWVWKGKEEKITNIDIRVDAHDFRIDSTLISWNAFSINSMDSWMENPARTFDL